MKPSCSLAIIMLLANVAHAQARKGSIGIIYHSENKIVIAADSQGNIVGGPPVYDECKVSALGKHMVFLNLNLTEWAGGPSPWSSTEIAHDAYKRMSVLHPDEELALYVAAEWARVVQSYLKLMYTFYPQAVLGVADNGVLIDALFGETHGDSLKLWAERIVIAPGNLMPIKVLEPIPVPLGLIPGGEINIFLEFTNATTERAKQEEERWNRQSEQIKPEDRDIMNAIRLATLTVTYDENRTVGGDIDALELRRGGEVRWKQRKNNCPAE